METVIPPRDHGPSTYRYTWDENGEVAQVTRISASPPAERDIVPDYVRTFLLHGTPVPTSPHNNINHNIVINNLPPHDRPALYDGPSRAGTPQLVVPRRRSALHRSRVADFFEGFRFSGGSWAGGGGGENGGGGGENGGGGGENGGGGGAGGGDGEEVGARPGSRDSGLGLGSELGRVDSREGVPVGVGEEERFFLGEGARGEKGGVGGGGGGDDGGIGEWRVWRGGGWRAMVAVIVLVTLAVLITGFVCLVVAISGVDVEAGRSAVFEGDCGRAAAVDWGLHAVINVFVVVLVGAANYVFQVLSSPTREEVAAAHQRGGWLDIGIPSLRNLKRIEGGRALLAVVVLATAVFTQIMYNAVIFVSQTAPDYKAAMVGEAFLRGAPLSNDISNDGTGFSRPDLLSLQQQAARGELIRIPTQACIDQFSGAFETAYSAVLLVSSLDTFSLTQKSGGIVTNSINGLAPDTSSIQYCLAQPAPAPTCEVNLNASLLGSVALLNSIALVVTAALLFKRPSSFRPLATLGDAIASFLEEPDTTTQGACLLSKTDIWRGRWPLEEAKYWVPKNHYWFRSISLPRWMATFIIWAISIGLTAAGIAFSTTFDPSGQLSAFGTASPHALMHLPSNTPPAAAAVLASLPQLLLAALYFTTNALLTTYYLSHESSLFATGPARPLRVSARAVVGAQSTSLYLTLPRPASWLLMALFAGMAFVLRQSCFAVAARLVDVPVSPNALPSDDDMGGDDDPLVVALGLSGVGLLVLLVALVVLALAVLGLGLRRAPPVGLVNGEMLGNPMVLPAGSCSAVVHADASSFAQGVTKEDAYQQVLQQAEGLFYEQRNWVRNLSNVASLLWHAYQSLPSPSNQVNWAGFYTLDPLSPATRPQLILGPFQGKVACQTIAFGRGVCGAAAATGSTQVVSDVREFPGHIACDAASRSEVVVPITVADGKEGGRKKVVGIIDVDCEAVGGFDEVDRVWLERLAGLIAEACDWP
ncbi:uncharacterized protein B0H64DRAFT_471194 [Chaetomium fimeti]|uniref:GAF domain-containing protein n=1 Tax=Chaetomium fimeti TaxID=1854472 RepID=A0AAE0HRL7_9PEZI|nr:hypothetical protein B0H64DRAFT_471194 [Chaetomium fimeti]